MAPLPARQPAHRGVEKPPLDSAPALPRALRFSPTLTMGQQTNKHIKKKRRIAYLKRKKEAAKTAAKKTPKSKK